MVPWTCHCEVDSLSSATGPRAWRRHVAIPISAPSPNSPPSANWVEAFHITIAESTRARNDSATSASSATIVSRSEEHTSELQSLMRTSYAVFCSQKKKTNHSDDKTYIMQSLMPV